MTQNNVVLLLRPPITKMLFPMVNPPIGLGYLTSYLEQHGFKVYLIDFNIRNISMHTFESFIQKINPLLIGITALTQYYPGLVKLSNAIKTNNPGIPIVLGGIHVSALPEQSLFDSGADFIVMGEGELTLLELARALQQKKKSFLDIKGLAFNDAKGDVILTPSRELIENLDDLPFPAWKKMNPSWYPPEPHGMIMKYSKVAPILSTRGCPFNCSYCASCNFWNQRIRFRSAKNIVDEIQFLHENFGIKEIHFWDDNLTLKKSHIIGICKEIVKRGLNNMAFNAPNGIRADKVDAHILKIMKMAGFYSITFAVESADYQILKKNGKNVDPALLMHNAKIAHELGYHLSSFYIIGFPEETERTIRKTIEFARRFPPGNKKFFILTPLPGSRIFDKFIAEHDFQYIDWNKFSFLDGEYTVSERFTPDQLRYWLQQAFHVTVLPITTFITTLYIRFIKYGHFSQIRAIIARAKTLLLSGTKGFSGIE